MSISYIEGSGFQRQRGSTGNGTQLDPDRFWQELYIPGIGTVSAANPYPVTKIGGATTNIADGSMSVGDNVIVTPASGKFLVIEQVWLTVTGSAGIFTFKNGSTPIATLKLLEAAIDVGFTLSVDASFTINSPTTSVCGFVQYREY